MSWIQVCFDVSSELAEDVSDLLMDIGALSVSIEDALAETGLEKPIFGEPGEPGGQVWENNRIVVLLDAAADPDALMKTLSEQAKVIVSDYTVEEVAEQDWVRLTQSQFEPISISSRLWITPTWHESPAPQAINLHLDPGLAFGTGSHPTTRLCLEWLDEAILGGERVLDYGCGSGILAIAASKLGAGEVIGVDIDPQAVRTSQDNAVLNEVVADFFLPDGLVRETFDIVLANILANPLRLLGELLQEYVKAGGKIVLSGILDSQAEELSTIYSRWFVMDEPVFLDGWVRLSGSKKGE